MVEDERKAQKITAVKQYLKNEFPDLEIRHHSKFDEMAEVFTVIKGPPSNFLRLMVCEDYLNDHTEQEVANTLKNREVAQILSAHEGQNLFIGNRGFVFLGRD